MLRRNVRHVTPFVLFCLTLLCASPILLAQSTTSSGSIQGTITDPQGAVVPAAKVTVVDEASGQSKNLQVSNSGTFNTGPILPGRYVVKATATGFGTVEQSVTVQVGNTTTANVKLGIVATETVSVNSNAIHVNTEQASVQGVLNADQIESLPINGRNFLDLAQLEPGVQIQDGGGFDPTKNGFSSISVGGRFGRTARIEVDGIDISDETVGTTTQNISAGAIQEFQISQSSLDLSTSLTSSGAVNVTTKSGTKTYHGDSFYLFRDKALSANFPGGIDAPYQRNHFGGSIGGPVVPGKEKLFFFANAEHIKQELAGPVIFPAPFQALSGLLGSPFRDTEALGRLDYQATSNLRIFYRFTYENNSDVRSFAPDFQAFNNRDNTPSHVVGADFSTGSFSHSIRFGYLKFTNHIADAVLGSSIPNPTPGVSISIGGVSPRLRFGPNALAPQATFQSNKQLKYDGSKLWGNHIFRYGVGVNRILGGGFASFFGITPRVSALANSAGQTAAAAGPFAGGISNPLNYPVTAILMGNGQGSFTELPEFGMPAGGQFDTRLTAYLGDSWKLRPNITATFGLRYVRDTGRADSDLDPIPCSAIDTAVFTTPPCTGATPLLDQFGAGLGAKVRQPNANFGPQLGLTWDPFNNGKTVIRAGIGLYYENAVFNNVLFDRPGRLSQGLFFGTASLCPSGTLSLPGGVTQTSINGKDIATQICGQPIGSVANDIAALQKGFQAATAAAGAQANPNFIGETLANGANSTGNNFIAPTYQTPRSVQINVGVQREIHPGTVLSADYIRNVGTHFLLAVDTNHVGDSRFLNKAAALNAISATTGGLGCAGGASAAAINCAIAAGASISDFADNGLDSGKAYLFGLPASLFGLDPTTGAAFSGINPNVGENEMLFSNGRSVYNALQLSLRQNVTSAFRGLKHANFQVGYSLSKYEAPASDGDFINNATDFRNPLQFFGPNALDRRHQLSFGGVLDTFLGIRTSVGAHFASPLSQTLFLEDSGNSGEIFRTDVTGDGTNGDVLPGTNIGSYGRSITGSAGVNGVINAFNTTTNQLTPAGQALVDAGLFTVAQLQALGATRNGGVPIPTAVAGIPNLSILKVVDFKVSRPFKIGDRFSIEPGAAFFNLFNFANFDGSGALPSGILSGSAGSLNQSSGDPLLAREARRLGLGTGVFSQGSARQVEFSLRLSF